MVYQMSVVGVNGVEKRLALPLPDDELEALHFSANSIKAVLKDTNLI